MVLFHTLRVYRSIMRGKMDKAATFEAYNKYLKATSQPAPAKCALTGEQVLPLCAEAKCKLYMGLRMTDMFGHINNSRYIEAMEFARWHQMASTGLYERVNKAQLVPIVSSVDVQYVREIKPCSTVAMRTQIGSASGRNMVFYQQIESLKGDVVHATGLVRFCWLNARGYKGKDGAVPRPGPVALEEAMVRMGYAEADVAAYMDGSAVGDLASTQYFGKPVSNYDKKLSPLVTANSTDANLIDMRAKLALCNTFPQEKINAVNAADEAWRNLLRKETKTRREMFAKKK